MKNTEKIHFFVFYLHICKKSCTFAANLKLVTIMPQISTFYGIIIFMNFQDHAPAHFHAWYGDYKISVSIKDSVVKGEMPGRALRMVLEWLDLHRDELMENWERAQKGIMVERIVPLK